MRKGLQLNTIKIGSDRDYKQIRETLGVYVLFRKTPKDGRPVSFVIIHRRRRSDPDARPTGVLAEFKEEASAVTVLERWAVDLHPPKPARKIRKTGAARCNSNWLAQADRIDVDQLELALQEEKERDLSSSPKKYEPLVLQKSSMDSDEESTPHDLQ